MILVNFPGNPQTTFSPFRHSAWRGSPFANLIFPWFLCIIGFSAVVSGRNQAGGVLNPRRAAIRAGKLIAVGLALTFLSKFSLAFDFNTLERIGVMLLLAVPFLQLPTGALIRAISLLAILHILVRCFLLPPGVVWKERFLLGSTSAEYIDALIDIRPRGILLPFLGGANCILLGVLTGRP